MDNKPGLSVGQRVELAPGMEEVYPKAAAGMRGTIRGFTEDEYNFDRCYVEWDREHWRYNGEADLWAYPSHFRPAQVDGDHDLLGAEEQDIPTVPNISDEDLEEEYIDQIMTACDRASEANGFYLVTMKRDEENRIQLEIISAANDDELRSLSGADVFQFVEREMRQRGL